MSSTAYASPRGLRACDVRRGDEIAYFHSAISPEPVTEADQAGDGLVEWWPVTGVKAGSRDGEIPWQIEVDGLDEEFDWDQPVVVREAVEVSE